MSKHSKHLLLVATKTTLVGVFFSLFQYMGRVCGRMSSSALDNIRRFQPVVKRVKFFSDFFRIQHETFSRSLSEARGFRGFHN